MKLVVLSCLWLVVFSQTWVKENDNNEYLIGRNIVNSFEEARSECVKYNAQLTIIITTFQTASFDFLKQAIGTPSGRPYSYYIGATFNTSTNRFYWVNGIEMKHGQWDASAGEPAAVGNKYCVIMGSLTELDPTYKWRTATCSVASGYICQRNLSKASSSTTTTFKTTTRKSTTPTISPATATTTTQPHSTSQKPKTLSYVAKTITSGKTTRPITTTAATNFPKDENYSSNISSINIASIVLDVVIIVTVIISFIFLLRINNMIDRITRMNEDRMAAAGTNSQQRNPTNPSGATSHNYEVIEQPDYINRNVDNSMQTTYVKVK